MVSKAARRPQEVLGTIGESRLFVEERGIPGTTGYYRRLCVRCPKTGDGHGDAAHPCMKRRGTSTRQTKNIGPKEPEAFLSVWCQAADRFATREEHIAFIPDIGEVTAFATSKGWH